MSTRSLILGYFLGQTIRRRWRLLLVLIALLFAWSVWEAITQ